MGSADFFSFLLVPWIFFFFCRLLQAVLFRFAEALLLWRIQVVNRRRERAGGTGNQKRAGGTPRDPHHPNTKRQTVAVYFASCPRDTASESLSPLEHYMAPAEQSSAIL
uniref:Putative secreted protein n=1 Tax=Ixodes ricinus TaxID=34613 RepID=A0A6B0UCJ3_IXORI